LEIAQYIYLKAEIVRPRKSLNVVQEDPSDNKFLECAIEGKADYLVSGDNHLLKLKEFEKVKIISVTDFLSIIEKK
jgi:hypothetical protein